MFRSVLKASPQKAHLMSMQSRSLQGLVVGVPKESFEGERRVAIAPVHVAKLKKAGATVNIEAGAGAGSGYFDEIYVKAGANMVSSDEAWKAQVVAKVRPPTSEEAKRIGNRALVSIVQPRQNVGKCKTLFCVCDRVAQLTFDNLFPSLCTYLFRFLCMIDSQN